jgi:glycosyltransferase involved in cell wall biosynthesis
MKEEEEVFDSETGVTISVLMSVYNTEIELVKRAIESVLIQDFQDFELIIIDDGSESETHIQLLEYVEKILHEVIYIRHTNRGQSLSINRGILNSKGKYIAILDADDEFKPNHLSACLEELENFDLIASTTDTIVDEEADYFVPDKFDFDRLIHVDDCILFATLFGKREVFETIGFESQYAADAHFFEQAAKSFKVKKADLRTYIYYRNNPDSVCSTLKRETQLLNS